jgi:hypothetical protein
MESGIAFMKIRSAYHSTRNFSTDYNHGGQMPSRPGPHLATDLHSVSGMVQFVLQKVPLNV